MSEPLAYLNGQFLPQSQAVLPLHDAGFVWGATITDLCRTFRQQLFRFADHLARFRQSCGLARVRLAVSDEELTVIANRVATENVSQIKLTSELALVLFATPGPIGYYLGQTSGAGQREPTLGLHTFPLPFQRYRRLFTEGARLVIPSVLQVSPATVDPRIKQRSRLHWWIAGQEVHDGDPDASALLVDSDGFITETATANVLLVQNGRIRTPRRSKVLGGISLAVVEELCRQLGIPFEEADLTPGDCRRADEAMLSNTAFCLAPVRSIGRTEMPICPGPVFQRLIAAWSAMVGVDIIRQVVASVEA